MKEQQEIGLRLAETLVMAELFGKSDDELIKEAKQISEKTLRVSILQYLTLRNLSLILICYTKGFET